MSSCMEIREELLEGLSLLPQWGTWGQGPSPTEPPQRLQKLNFLRADLTHLRTDLKKCKVKPCFELQVLELFILAFGISFRTEKYFHQWAC